MRGRPAGRSPAGSRSRILQDIGEGTGRNRRRHGGARERGVTARYVENAGDLAALIGAARREPRVAMDTEAASFHRYHDRIYLLQLSTPSITALIDPLAIDDLAPVGALLADGNVEKVFHDADYVLRALDGVGVFPAGRLSHPRGGARGGGEP